MKYCIPVFFVCFFACTNEKIESPIFCKNELRLVSGITKPLPIELNFNDSFAFNFEKIERQVSETRDGFLVFQHAFWFDFEDQQIQVPLQILVRSRRRNQSIRGDLITTQISHDNKLIVFGDPCMKIGIKERIWSIFEKQEFTAFDFKTVCYEIKWPESNDQRFLFSVIQEITKAFLVEAKKYAMEKHGKNICDLDEIQFSDLQEYRPFRLILSFGLHDYIPPPPPLPLDIHDLWE